MFTVKQIFKESIFILFLTTVFGIFAGLFLNMVEDILLVVLPLVVILPALNGMIGDLGIIMVSRCTTALYEKVSVSYHSRLVKHLFKDIFPIAIFCAVYISIIATFIAYFKGFYFDYVTLLKIVWITLATTITLVMVVFIVAVVGSVYVYKKKVNPDDVLIPVITSIADMASMVVFSFLVLFLF